MVGSSRSWWRRPLHCLVTATSLSSFIAAPVVSAVAQDQVDAAARIRTETPIKHIILIIGENRTFDHVFATYRPRHGQSVFNLLSEGIVNADGIPRRGTWHQEFSIRMRSSIYTKITELQERLD